MADTQKFLMLITVTEGIEANPQLMEWIHEIDRDYMDKFGIFGPSVAHLKITDASTLGTTRESGHRSPFQFALLFPGTRESVNYLARSIESRAKGEVGILALQGEDLPTLRAR